MCCQIPLRLCVTFFQNLKGVDYFDIAVAWKSIAGRWQTLCFSFFFSELVTYFSSCISVSRFSQMEKTKINNFMLLLTNDRDSSGFIKRIGEASGGQFVIEWQMTLKHLATSLIQSVIKERFGGESLRIFTVLLHKGTSEGHALFKLATPVYCDRRFFLSGLL